MDKLTIVRLTRSSSDPTYGVLLYNNLPRMFTLELPDLGNHQDKSCIPLGTYTAEVVHDHTTNKGMVIDTTLKVLDVPSRTGILFHIGNSVRDTSGCILLGMEVGLGGILFSKPAMDVFTDIIFGTNIWELTIKQA